MQLVFFTKNVFLSLSLLAASSLSFFQLKAVNDTPIDQFDSTSCDDHNTLSHTETASLEDEYSHAAKEIYHDAPNNNQALSLEEMLLAEITKESPSAAAIKMMLDAGAKIIIIAHLLIDGREYANVTPLMIAAMLNKIDAVRVLLDNPSVQINLRDSRDFSALTYAIAEGHLEVAKLLLENGADANHDCFVRLKELKKLLQTPEANDPDLIIEAHILTHDHDLCMPPLRMALAKNNTQAVNLLLSHKANPNAIIDENGSTALMAAVQQENIAMVKNFLSHDADVNLGDPDNIRPIHMAIGNPVLVKLLLSHNAELNFYTPFAKSVIEVAIQRETTAEELRFLLDHNARVSFVSLFMALQHQRSDVAWELLKKFFSISNLFNFTKG